MKVPKNRTYYLSITPHNSKEVIRVLEVLSESSLFQLAHSITISYGYYLDHAFGFYDSIDEENYFLKRTSVAFELFGDVDKELGVPPENPGTKSVPLTDLWLKKGDTWYFLFDYGATRIFDVTLIKFGIRDQEIIYPNLMLKVGEAKPQYPGKKNPGKLL